MQEMARILKSGAVDDLCVREFLLPPAERAMLGKL